MIRLLNHKDEKRVLEYLYQEPSFNIFPLEILKPLDLIKIFKESMVNLMMMGKSKAFY